MTTQLRISTQLQNPVETFSKANKDLLELQPRCPSRDSHKKPATLLLQSYDSRKSGKDLIQTEQSLRGSAVRRSASIYKNSFSISSRNQTFIIQPDTIKGTLKRRVYNSDFSQKSKKKLPTDGSLDKRDSKKRLPMTLDLFIDVKTPT